MNSFLDALILIRTILGYLNKFQLLQLLQLLTMDFPVLQYFIDKKNLLQCAKNIFLGGSDFVNDLRG